MSSHKAVLIWLLFLICCLLQPFHSSASFYNWTHGSHLRGIELPTHSSFNAVTSSAESSCDHHLDAAGSPAESLNEDGRGALFDAMDGDDDGAKINGAAPAPLKLHVKHTSTRDAAAAKRTKKESLKHSTYRDVHRIQTVFRRINEKKNQNAVSRLAATADHHRPVVMTQKATVATPPELAGPLMASVESGVTLGSGEYFIDVFVGTPPRHFPLILDTGSDLNWIQCLPCHDCFEQHGPFYDPAASSSFRNVSCSDPRCGLVSSPDPPRPCRAAAAADGGHDQTCPYFYWYGDRSNTTGDLALETFTVNLTAPDGAGAESRRVDDVIFGCGHWNRGLFHGAAGLLGLGRGPLSFASQLRSLYGQSFSYCLVDWNSDISVSSKLILGEDQSLLGHPRLNYTSFVAGKENPVDTFYYVQIKAIVIGGEALQIPPETWELAKDGSGGTIVDSGTTLTYFADAAYQKIKEAFVKRVKYPMVVDFPVLFPCYNVSGVSKVELPEFKILFGDGAAWNFPVENYFIRLDPEEIMCLAVLPTPQSPLGILGNYLQQNFHILYDLKNSRLGFAPQRCADM